MPAHTPTAAPPAPSAPEKGQMTPVAPGVWWIRLGLPYKLDHINIWALDDGDGWTLVDTGVRTEDNVAVWERLAASAPLDRPLKRIIVTHMHPDHIGMAGWLTRRHGVALHITRTEYMACRVLMSDSGREAPPEAIAFYQAAGWPRAALEGYRARFGNFGRHIHALPDSFVRLTDQQVLDIGGHEWRVIVGNGHSPEHACLYCPDRALFISGDQVLPRISSNVSVHPMEPDANPMADWFASLRKLRQQVADDVLVLPSHQDCFGQLHARIDDLARGQTEALERLRALLGEPRRVIDVFPALFKRPIALDDMQHLGLATGEAIACLNHLMHLGEVQREKRDGVAWYVKA